METLVAYDAPWAAGTGICLTPIGVAVERPEGRRCTSRARRASSMAQDMTQELAKLENTVDEKTQRLRERKIRRLKRKARRGKPEDHYLTGTLSPVSSRPSTASSDGSVDPRRSGKVMGGWSGTTISKGGPSRGTGLPHLGLGRDGERGRRGHDLGQADCGGSGKMDRGWEGEAASRRRRDAF